MTTKQTSLLIVCHNSEIKLLLTSKFKLQKTNNKLQNTKNKEQTQDKYCHAATLVSYNYHNYAISTRIPDAANCCLPIDTGGLLATDSGEALDNEMGDALDTDTGDLDAAGKGALVPTHT